MTLEQFVKDNTTRGECQCGRCIDVGTQPDPTHPHTVDMIFFKVAPTNGAATNGALERDQFLSLSAAHKGQFNDAKPLDGKEHSYLELGGWIGDQGGALQYMALGVILGVFDLMSPKTMFPNVAPDLALRVAGLGYISVKKKAA